jgi:DNA/RNA endonuclease YhcR with UshA esterase domain
VRLLGTTAVVDGRRVLSGVIAAVLSAGPPPFPENVTTATAAVADGGRLDAALVLVTGATISEAGAVPGGFRLRVSDGSGTLEVLLDEDIGFPVTAYTPGTVVNVTGVLVPISGSSQWRLKPRQSSDVVVVGG